MLPFGLAVTGQGEAPEDPAPLEPAELFEEPPPLEPAGLFEEPELRVELLDEGKLPEFPELLVNPEPPPELPTPPVVAVPPQDMVIVAPIEMIDAMIVRTCMATIPRYRLCDSGVANRSPPLADALFSKGHGSLRDSPVRAWHRVAQDSFLANVRWRGRPSRRSRRRGR